MATIFKAKAKVNKDDSVNRKDLEEVLEVLLEAVKRHRGVYISEPEIYTRYVDEGTYERKEKEKMIFKLNKKEDCIIITTDEEVKVKIVRK